MANTIRIKRRSAAGAAGAPTVLAPAELAYNENDNTLYYGFGDGGSGNSSSVISVAGSGAFMTTGTTQTISVAKTFSNITISGGSISGITDLAVADGGTGASSASSARTNLGAAASGANSDITSLTGLTTALSVGQGGTGATTASGARVNLLPTLTNNAEKVIAVNSNGTDIEYVSRVKAIAFQPPSSLFVDSNDGSFYFSSAPNISFSLINQTANKVFAGPTTGSATTPTFRTLVDTDIPALNYASKGANSDITSITGLTTALTVAQGGTGATTASSARTNLLPAYASNGGKVLAVNSGGTDVEYITQNAGTVTSVGILIPGIDFMVAGFSPVTTSGNIWLSWSQQSKNTMLMGPSSGANALPAFRTLTAADVPALSYLSTSGGTVSGNVVVTGSLEVQGSITTISSTTLTVSDKNIELATGSTTDAGANGGGLTLKGLTDKLFTWISTTSSWTSSENLDLASGKVLKINGTTVLSATAINGVDIDGGSF